MNIPPTTQNQPSQISSAVKNTTEYIGDAVESVSKNYTDVRSNVSNSLADFSNKASTNAEASKEFLTSNTIVAKVAFVLLVLFLFLFFLYLGINIIQMFINPSNNPYLVKGLISGSDHLTVPQDPTQQTSITLLRSNNQKTGLEFTWSTWIYISDTNNDSNKCQNIFNKGDPIYDPKTGLASSNGPGLYIVTGASNNDGSIVSNAGLRVVIDLVGGTDPANDGKPYSQVDITNIPIKKWVNVIIRMENTMMDTYINGVISNRTILPFIPKQNFFDVQVCNNGGFNGQLSNLRYYNRALNVIQINNIVFWGPNLNASKSISTTRGGFNYLSSTWYTGMFS